MSLAVTAHVLLNKRDPRAAIGWMVTCLAIPLVGIPAYFLFGINRIKRRARALSESARNNQVGRSGRIDANQPVRPFVRDQGEVCDITAYFSGSSAYAAMLAAIDASSSSVLMSQYIFELHGIGQRFERSLINAHRRGVAVYVLLDGIGSFYSRGDTARQLRKGGIHVTKFIPPSLWPPTLHINLRNHRKLLITDMQLAFLGGMNIRNDYIPQSPDQKAQISDAHFSVDGAMVEDIAHVFVADWFLAAHSVPKLPSIPAPVMSTGDAVSKLIVDGPDNDVDLITIGMQNMISRANGHIRLMTPYFLPPREIVVALQAAAVRGVTVSIILPGKNNLIYVHWATRHILWELLRYGVHVYYQQGQFNHSKLLAVDEKFSLIGSANVDPRSLRLNFEIGMEVESTRLATELSEYFDNACEESIEISISDIEERPVLEKLRDAFAWLLSPYF